MKYMEHVRTDKSYNQFFICALSMSTFYTG